MKRMTATALALTVAATNGAFAGNHTAGDTGTDMESGTDRTEMTATDTGDAAGMIDTADLIRTRDITGGAVYTTNEANDEGWNAAYEHSAVGAEWNAIGEIEDLVLSKDGQLVGIVAEIGGFLDIADKHVMIEVDDINLVAVDDRSYAYVTRLNEEDLESMAGVDEGFWN